MERRGQSWRVYWRLGGRGGAKQSTTWPTEKHARQAADLAAAHRHQISADEVYSLILGTPLPQVVDKPATPTVAEWADEWLASRTRITPGTKGRYRRQLDNEILPRIGDMALADVTAGTVATLLNELGETRADTTVTRYYAVLHSLFEWAVIERKIADNPARRTDYIRDLVAHDDLGEEGHVYLTRGEFESIHRAAHERARPLLRFLAESGCRWSEATAVQVADVDPLGKPPGVRIVRAWKQDDKGRWYLGSTKGRNRRTVPLPRHCIDELAPLLVDDDGVDQQGGVLLFRAPKGGRVIYSNFRSRLWLPALAASGIGQRPTIHDLRHTHVAWLIAAGRPLAAISRRIGHHSITITERVYAGILPEVDEATVAALEAAVPADDRADVEA